MGAEKLKVFFKAVVPSTVPSITATHLPDQYRFGLVCAVVGDLISSRAGLAPESNKTRFQVFTLRPQPPSGRACFHAMIRGFHPLLRKPTSSSEPVLTWN